MSSLIRTFNLLLFLIYVYITRAAGKYMVRAPEQFHMNFPYLSMGPFAEDITRMLKSGHHHSGMYMKQVACGSAETIDTICVDAVNNELRLTFRTNNHMTYEECINSGLCARKVISPLLKAATSILIDLREHRGGCIHEFTIALADLFGDGIQCVLLHKDGSDEQLHHVGIETTIACNGTWDLAVTAPITVLISRETCSAGEINATMLAGRKGVVLVGEPTYGNNSINDYFEVGDYGVMLTIGLLTGARGTVEETVVPDS